MAVMRTARAREGISMRLTIRGILLMTSLLSLAAADAALAGGRSCQRCGAKHDVKPTFRLVKVSQPIIMPEYAALKRESFFPDKGVVCHEGYRCDTIYQLWREPVAKGKGKALRLTDFDAVQSHHPRPLPPLQTSCHTVCGCQTHYGAKSTGCHESHCIRKPVGETTLVVPVLKWQAVHWCKDCQQKAK